MVPDDNIVYQGDKKLTNTQIDKNMIIYKKFVLETGEFYLLQII